MDRTDREFAIGRSSPSVWQFQWIDRTPSQNREVSALGTEQSHDEDPAFDEVDTTKIWSSRRWGISVAVEHRSYVVGDVQLRVVDGRNSKICCVCQGIFKKERICQAPTRVSIFVDGAWRAETGWQSLYGGSQ